MSGSVTDTGRYSFENYPNIYDVYKKGDPKSWGIAQIRKKGLRDAGGTLAPEAAHTISVGAETLAPRPFKRPRLNANRCKRPRLQSTNNF